MADVCNSVEEPIGIGSNSLQVLFQPASSSVSLLSLPKDIVVGVSADTVSVADIVSQAFGHSFSEAVGIVCAVLQTNTTTHSVGDSVVLRSDVLQVMSVLVEDVVALVCAATQGGFGDSVHDVVSVADVQHAVLTHALLDAIRVSSEARSGAVEAIMDGLSIQDAARGILHALSRADDVVTAQVAMKQVMTGMTRAEDKVAVLVAARGILDALTRSEGQVLCGSSAEDGEATEAWAAPSETLAMSKYVHPFIHAVAGTGDGRFVAIGREGLYLFTPGQDDEGLPVNAVIRSGQIDGGTMELKYPSVAYGHRARGQMQVLVSGFDTGAEDEGWFLTAGNIGAELAPMRVKLGRGIRSRQFRFGVQNVDGEDLEFTQVVYVIDATSRRV